VWVKTDRLHPLIPRTTESEAVLLARRGRARVWTAKHEWAMLPLRVRGLDRVRLHADLTILAKLTIALARRGRGACHLPRSSTLANSWQRYGARSGGG
jgi:hypothetical protein